MGNCINPIEKSHRIGISCHTLPTLRVYGDLEILGAPHGCTDIQNSWAAGHGISSMKPSLVGGLEHVLFSIFIYGMSSETH
jgi:hypothetical protein